MNRVSWKDQRFELYPFKIEQEFESIVKKRYNEVFWEGIPNVQMLYFDLKKRISSKAKEICVPDGILLWIEKSIEDCRIIVIEYELANHTDEHILVQLRRFKNAIDHISSRKIIIDAIVDEISKNDEYKGIWNAQLPNLPFYQGCSELFNNEIEVTVVIDEFNDRLKLLMKDIQDYKWIQTINVLEVKLYAPIANSNKKVLKKGDEVMALYPDGFNEWYRATILSSLKNDKYKVKWWDGDDNLNIVTNVSLIKELLIQTRYHDEV
jgi:hypothetical protein